MVTLVKAFLMLNVELGFELILTSKGLSHFNVAVVLVLLKFSIFKMTFFSLSPFQSLARFCNWSAISQMS